MDTMESAHNPNPIFYREKIEPSGKLIVTISHKGLSIQESKVVRRKWYHYDECWYDEYGPFDTRQEAENELRRYCKEVLGH